MAYLFQMARLPGHAVLMTLKMGDMGGEVAAFRRSKRRSHVITLIRIEFGFRHLKTLTFIMMAAAGVTAWSDREWRKILLPVASSRYKYRPFRIRPRITQFPSSVFTRQKTSVLHDELRKARELARDLKRIKVFYSLLISTLCLK